MILSQEWSKVVLIWADTLHEADGQHVDRC